MPTLVPVTVRKSAGPTQVDLDTLTPKARALAEAITMSAGHQPLGVLCDTGRTRGDNPNHTYLHGTGPTADAIAAEPDLRFMQHLEPLPRDAATSAEEWLEYNARQMPVDAWPIAGAASRMEPLTERVPSAEAARTDRCLLRAQVMDHLREHGMPINPQGWDLLKQTGHLPEPRHYAVDGRLPLWHVDDIDAYLLRTVDRWTVSQVAEHLGYQGPSANGSARKQLSRWGLAAVGRAPGRGGESLFAADQVQAAHAARPGSGRRGAERSEGGKFVGRN